MRDHMARREHQRTGADEVHESEGELPQREVEMVEPGGNETDYIITNQTIGRYEALRNISASDHVPILTTI